MAEPEEDSIVTEVVSFPNSDLEIVTLNVTADSGDGSVADFVTSPLYGFIYMATVVAGDPAPDALSLAVLDADSIDIFGTNLASLTLPVQAVPKIGSVYGFRRVHGSLTLSVTGNSTVSAKFAVNLFIDPPRNKFQ